MLGIGVCGSFESGRAVGEVAVIVQYYVLDDVLDFDYECVVYIIQFIEGSYMDFQ